MKLRWIFVIVGVVLVVVALMSSNVRSSLSGAGEGIGGFFSAILNAPERSQLNNLQDRFLRNNMSLQPHQTDYVHEVTDSFNSVRRFHKLYCIDGDKNPYLFGDNLVKFCSDIAQSSFMKNDE